MNRVYNFSAGPSMLPVPVLQKAQADLLDYHGSGMSVMEMSHRSKWFDEIIQNTEAARVPRCCTMPGNVHTICIFYLLQYATQAVLSMQCGGSRGKIFVTIPKPGR